MPETVRTGYANVSSTSIEQSYSQSSVVKARKESFFSIDSDIDSTKLPIQKSDPQNLLFNGRKVRVLSIVLSDVELPKPKKRGFLRILRDEVTYVLFRKKRKEKEILSKGPVVDANRPINKVPGVFGDTLPNLEAISFSDGKNFDARSSRFSSRGSNFSVQGEHQNLHADAPGQNYSNKTDEPPPELDDLDTFYQLDTSNYLHFGDDEWRGEETAG